MNALLARTFLWSGVIVSCLMAGHGRKVLAQDCRADWDVYFHASAVTCDGVVRAWALFDRGAGLEVMAAGSFTAIGGTPAANIARWDGREWHPLGEGLDASVYALAVYDDGSGPALYAGGSFTRADGWPTYGIARWNGYGWSDVGGGVTGAVYALTTYADYQGTSLIVAGNFDFAGSAPANNIAKWSVGGWDRIGSGIPCDGNCSILALTVFDSGSGTLLAAGSSSASEGKVYVSGGYDWWEIGTFPESVSALASFADGSVPRLMAAHGGAISGWDSSQWTLIAGWPEGSVHALAVFDDGSGPRLYAGGSFSDPAIRYLARWDGSQWWGLQPPITAPVEALLGLETAFDNALYVGGSQLMKWDGATLGPLVSGNGVNGPVTAFRPLDASFDGTLLALGQFSTAGPRTSRGIACWHRKWTDLDNGITTGQVRDVAVFDDLSDAGPMLYVAGSFSEIGGVAADNVARWDGNRWWPLNAGTNLHVNALAVYSDWRGSALYAAGEFFMAGFLPANRIARWDGQQWEPLGTWGSGLADGEVRALAVAYEASLGNPVLFAGGDFDYADDQPIAALARWEGWKWSDADAGFGPDDSVTRLDVIDGVLYVSGVFNSVGGQPARNIVRWLGNQWDTLGGGITAGTRVNAWVIYDDGNGPALYAAGDFTEIGGVPARRIAKWNGQTWLPLGSYGLNGEAKALAVFDDGTGPALYVGGDFTSAGGLAARRIARWNGQNWSVLGIGINSGANYAEPATVNALAVYDDGEGRALYVGGEFATAGNAGSSNIARWSGPRRPVITRQPPERVVVAPGQPLILSVAADGSGPIVFQWYKEGRGELPNEGTISGAGTSRLTINPAGPGDSGYYFAGAYYPELCEWVATIMVTVQVMADADGDGVADDADACPDTIPNITVDAAGCPPLFRGDFNRDGDVDGDDLDRFQSCSRGPGMIALPAGCQNADLDADQDVDQDDFGAFQRCLSGTDTPGQVGCGGG